MAQAVPRRDRRGEVRRQRDDLGGAAGSLRRRHRLPALRRHQAGRGARRRPADLEHARPSGDPERVQGRLPRDLDGGDQRRAHGAHRSDQSAARREDQLARPVRRGHLGRRCGAVRRTPARCDDRRRGGEPRPRRQRRDGRPDPRARSPARRPDPRGRGRRARPRPPRAHAQHQRRRGGVRARAGARREEARDPHGCARPLRRLAQPRFARVAPHGVRAHEPHAQARIGHDPEDAGLPRCRDQRRAEGLHHRWAGAELFTSNGIGTEVSAS